MSFFLFFGFLDLDLDLAWVGVGLVYTYRLAHPPLVLPPSGVDVPLEPAGHDEAERDGRVALPRGARLGAVVVVGDNLPVAGDHEVAVGLDELEELGELVPLRVADLHVLIDVRGGDVLLVPRVEEVAGGSGHCVCFSRGGVGSVLRVREPSLKNRKS